MIGWACDSELEGHNAAGNQREIGGNDNPLLFDFLKAINIDMRQMNSYSTDDLLEKYDRVVADYSTDQYAKAAMFLIIEAIVENGDYKNEKILFLLKELEKFEMAYPKQSYILLEEARRRNALTPSEIQSFGERAYQKALSKAYIYESELKRPAPAPNDSSYSADVYRKRLIRAEFTEKLRKYTSASK